MRNPWTREELILAFNLYCKVTFTKINANNKHIRAFGELIGRSNSAVALKLANFARLDPALQSRGVSGMTNGSKGEIEIWNEFNENWDLLAYESERLLSKFKNEAIESTVGLSEFDLTKVGLDKESVVKVRINQYFFRKMVLASYDNRCCITGINIPDLLIASHIVPWSVDNQNRVNPHNGICLNALYDRAFDKGLITVFPDYHIKVSSALICRKEESLNFLTEIDSKKIILPQRFLPKKEFLDYHNQHIFIN